jgi:hypothetical protein
VLENGTPGSVRGQPGNRLSYRDEWLGASSLLKKDFIMRIIRANIAIIALLLVAYVGSANAQGRTATVISENANLRESPFQAGEVKQEIDVGTNIKVLDQKGAWYVVRIGDLVGWMHGNAFRYGSGSDAEQSKPAIDEGPSSPVNTKSHPTRSRSDTVQSNDSISRSSSGRTYNRGPRGGCYYYNGSGRKVYVDRSLCN